MGAQTVAEQTLQDHLRELRRRLSYSIAVLLAGSAVGYVFRDSLFGVLQKPLGQQLFYTSPMGSFEFLVKLCLLVGFVLAVPVLLYNILRFIEPALEKILTKRLIVTVLSFSYLLMCAGIAFGYFFSLPIALHFFANVGSDNLKPLISIDQYFRFVIGYLAVFAVIFQLPLILLFSNHVKTMPPGSIGKWRKFVVIGAFALGIIVPMSPDPISQLILALPVILLYELSNVLVYVVNRKHRRAARQVTFAATPAQESPPAPFPELTAPIPQPVPVPVPIEPEQSVRQAPVAAVTAPGARPTRTMDVFVGARRKPVIRRPITPVRQMPSRVIQRRSRANLPPAQRGLINDVMKFRATQL